MAKDRIFFLGVLVLIIGIAYGSFFEPTGIKFVLIVSAVLVAVGTVFRSGNLFWWGMFAVLFLGAAEHAARERIFFEQLPTLAGDVSGEVRVVSDPETRDFFRKVVVRFDTCASAVCPGADILWQAPLSFREPAGTRLSFQCQLARPENFSPDFDYAMYLAKSGTGYVCEQAVSAEVLPSDWSGRARAWLYEPKHVLEGALSRILSEPEAGLAKGLLLGGDGYLPSALKEAFARVGLSHMIAVSGYNIALIAEMLLALGIILGLWRKQSIWFALVGIVFFIMMIGLPASAARAGAMAGIVFVALQFGRLTHPVRALLFAGGIMLLFNPLLLRYDIGFQLSFLATFGILVAMPYYERLAPQQAIIRKMGEVLFMTLAVELFVLPIILFSFHAFSPLILIGNFLVLLVPFAMAAAFVAAVVYLLVPGIGMFLAWAAFGFLVPITWSVEYLGSFQAFSLAVYGFGIWQLIGWYVILGGSLWFLSRSISRAYEKYV